MRHAWALAALLLAGSAAASEGLAFGRAQRSVSSARDAGFIPASANSDDSRGAELARIRFDDGRVVDRASGKPLRFELVKGAIKVDLERPVPKDGERRIRIFRHHRAEQDREITYWLLAPESGQFRISHDFTVSRPGQRSVHSFVRKGSTVTQAVVIGLDTGQTLKTYNVTGKDVNALGYYPDPTPDDTVVVQADLPHALAEGESARVRVVETYTDAERYVSLDDEGRVACRFVNLGTTSSTWC